MKKILILVNHEVVIYNFRKEIVERLISEGHQVIISSPLGEKTEKLKEMGAEISKLSIDRHGKNVFSELKLIFYYYKLIKDTSPDIILTYTIKPNIYGSIMANLLKIPSIVNITGIGGALENPGIARRITVNLYKFALKNVQRVFFQNEDNLCFFKKNIKSEIPAKILPGSGVNLKEFEVLQFPESEQINFTYIGRVMEDKGISEFFAAAKYISKEYNNVKFNICGFVDDKKYTEELEELNKIGIINYLGNLTDIKPILAQTHCIIHPSYHEGMSNVLLEAAASGRPAIASDIPGCREIINAGESGYLFAKKDENKLIAYIEKFIAKSNTEQREMGLKARSFIEQNFDRQIIVEEYMNEINKI